MSATEIVKNLQGNVKLARMSDRSPFAPHGRCAHCGAPFDKATTEHTCADCLAVFMAAQLEERAKLAAPKPAPVPSALAANLAARRVASSPKDPTPTPAYGTPAAPRTEERKASEKERIHALQNGYHHVSRLDDLSDKDKARIALDFAKRFIAADSHGKRAMLLDLD